MDVAFQIGGAILALGLVLFLAWWLLRWMNKRLPGVGNGAGRMIRVLDRVPVGKSGQLMLLRVKDKVLLVAVTEHSADKLLEFDDPNGSFAPAPAGDGTGFSSALRDAAQRLRGGPKDGGELP